MCLSRYKRAVFYPSYTYIHSSSLLLMASLLVIYYYCHYYLLNERLIGCTPCCPIVPGCQNTFSHLFEAPVGIILCVMRREGLHILYSVHPSDSPQSVHFSLAILEQFISFFFFNKYYKYKLSNQFVKNLYLNVTQK